MRFLVGADFLHPGQFFFYFQFSLWDSTEIVRTCSPAPIFSFNSLYEIRYLSHIGYLLSDFLFQFSLWDSIIFNASMTVSMSRSFNSLYEIRYGVSSGSRGADRVFQFSLWDSIWRQLEQINICISNFQFSLWDSPDGRHEWEARIRYLSILSMRFNAKEKILSETTE